MNKVNKGLPQLDFSRLLSAIDEAAIVAVTDAQGVITYVNKKFCAISKYSESELIGKTHALINSQYHPKEFFSDMWDTIRAGKNWEGEIRNRAKDGQCYWVHTTIVPFLDDEGQPVQYVAVRYEITERKVAEEQLQIYAKKLEVSNQELQDFASVAAHDLQEPLRKIQSFADRARVKAKDTMPLEAQDYLDRVQVSAKRMQTLINDLLTYSRVTTKAKPFTCVSLEQILKQVCSDLEVRIEQSHGKVLFHDLPSLDADATQLRQLFQNLISNGLKFHKPGMAPVMEVTAEIKSNRSEREPCCEIRVKDNGIGFDEKYLDRIFTIFQRLHGRHEYEGTGIGLAVCRKIVERHGGLITAESSLGQGAAFIVKLPLRHETGVQP